MNKDRPPPWTPPPIIGRRRATLELSQAYMKAWGLSEDAAKRIASSGKPPEETRNWTDDEFLSVRYLGVRTLEEIRQALTNLKKRKERNAP